MSDHHSPVKPGSITAVQVIAWIKVGFVGIAMCGMLALTSQVRAGTNTEVGGLIALLLAFFAAFGVVYILIAINIPNGRNWARILAIVVEVVNLVSLPFVLGNMAGPAVGGVVVGVVLSIVIIVSAASADSRHYCQEMA